MSIFTTIRNHQRTIIALDILRRRAEASAPYKGAEKTGAWVAVVTLAAMLLLWSLPESEFIIWLRLTVLYFVYVCLGGCIVALTALLLAGAFGQAVVEAYHSGRRTDAEIKALQAAEPVPAVEAETKDPTEWSYPSGPRPYLTDSERRDIDAYPNPKLNLATGERVKAGFAAGMNAAQISAQIGISENLVRRYIGIFNRGRDAALSVDFD